MDKEALAKQSPLGLLGLPETGPDLLDEVMKGRVQAPGNPLTKGFGSAKASAFELAQPIDMPESAKRVIDDQTPGEVQRGEDKKEDQVQADDLEEVTAEAPEPTASGEEIPAYFHQLNESHEQIRQRQDSIDQALKESQTRERAWQQYIQQSEQHIRQNHQQQQRQPEPQQDDYSWAAQGFESPEHFKQYQDSVGRIAEQRANQIVESQMLPLYHNHAIERFKNATEHCSKTYERFNEYFPQDQLVQFFNAQVQKYGSKQAASMDFAQEFAAAYKIRDYDRLVAQQSKEDQTKKAAGQTQKNAKQEQKAALKLVPKANQQGAPPSRQSIEDEMKDMDMTKLGVRGVGRLLRQRLSAQ